MLSVVVPVLNGATDLGACLASVAGADEIVVVDGGSSDDSAERAATMGASVFAAPRGRGSQLHAGAEAARGDWLLFLHADTRLCTGWQAAVAAHIAAAPDTAGYCALRLDDAAWQARIIERGVAARSRLFGLPYGDQGLLVSRRLYDEVGGYRSLALMEDVDFVRRLGRRRLRPLAATALTSADRWRRDGWLHRSTRNLSCLALYGAGVSPARLARLYR